MFTFVTVFDHMIAKSENSCIARSIFSQFKRGPMLSQQWLVKNCSGLMSLDLTCVATSVDLYSRWLQAIIVSCDGCEKLGET